MNQVDLTQDITIEPQQTRRSFLGTAGVAAVGAGAFALGAGFTAPACNTQNLSGWITTIVTAFGEMKPLLAQLGLTQTTVDKISGWIDKGVRIAKTFDDAYRAGKFKDALSLFTELGGLITQIAGELGQTDNRIVKLALISVSIARIAIAALLQRQADAQPQATAAAMSTATSEEEKQVEAVRKLASTDVSKILELLPR